MMELVKCARMGLVPDGQEAAIVPFKQHPKLMPMVWGLVKLAQQSGALKSLYADLVYTEDEFEIIRNETGLKFQHTPYLDGDRGELRGAYAVAHLSSGLSDIEYVNAETLEKVEEQVVRKNTSKGGSSNTPWSGPYKGEMQKKTALKRLLKRLPRTNHMDEFIRVDNEDFIEGETVAQPAPPVSKKKTLREIVVSESERPPLTEDGKNGNNGKDQSEVDDEHPF